MQVIFTHHAKERLHKRRVRESDVEKTIRNPDRSLPAQKKGTVKFIRQINGRQHHVVAKLLPDKQKWLVLSVWIRGEEDFNWVQSVLTLPFKLIFGLVKAIILTKKTQ